MAYMTVNSVLAHPERNAIRDWLKSEGIQDAFSLSTPDITWETCTVHRYKRNANNSFYAENGEVAWEAIEHRYKVRPEMGWWEPR